MKVSLNWAQGNSNVDLKKLSEAELVKKLGAQLGAIEEVINYGTQFDGVLVAKVISVNKHENADKLTVCIIDDGKKVKKVERDKNGLIQVVCGAPNVKPGMLVVWIPPGVTVPSTFYKEPFVLESRKIRGATSNGMLASAHELGISEDHSGILEINPNDDGAKNVKPGQEFKTLYELDDLIIDCENKMFTHRPDCFGILGVAREIAGIENQKFVSPKWYINQLPIGKTSENKLPIDVLVEDRKLVPRFMAVAISDVKVEPSPVSIQTWLSRVGIRPINNIVDITNFMMHLTGQPLHAYDWDKLNKISKVHPKLIARKAKKGEKVELLGGKITDLDNETIVIATDEKVVAIGGVMGGSETEVDETTKNIVLECANFDMYSIRRASMKLGLFTDAVTRFNKGQSAKQNPQILAEAVRMVEIIAGGKIASKVCDEYQGDKSQTMISVDEDFINIRLATHLKNTDIKKMLENVEFEVKVQGKSLQVTPPFWRMDIHIKEDIVEEIGRLYGLDKLPVVLPNKSLKPVQQDGMLNLKSKLREVLSSMGANEVLSYSFIHKRLIESANQDSKLAYQLSNALSPDLHYYRLTLTPSLVEKVHANIKADYIRNEDNEFALFEINKAHSKKEIDKNGLPIESENLAFVFAADDKTSKKKYKGAPYYQAKIYLGELFKSLHIQKGYELINADKYFYKSTVPEIAKPYMLKKSAVIVREKELIGIVGEFSAKTAEDLKLPRFCAGFEIDLSRIIRDIGDNFYLPLPKYPKISQDISLETNFDTFVAEIVEKIENSIWTQIKSGKKYIVHHDLIDIYQGSDLSKKTLTFRFWFWSEDKTLKTSEINVFMDSLASELSITNAVKRI